MIVTKIITGTKRMMVMKRRYTPSHERYGLLVFGTARVLQVPELDMPAQVQSKVKNSKLSNQNILTRLFPAVTK